jgi:small-conductance mechanosensitive channel
VNPLVGIGPSMNLRQHPLRHVPYQLFARSGRRLAAGLAAVFVLAISPPVSALGKSASPLPGPSAPVVGKPAPPSPSATQATPEAIGVTDIPLEADRLQTTLRALEERIAPTPSVADIEGGLPAMAQRIRDAQLETRGHLELGSSLALLSNLTDLWREIQEDLQAWARELHARATDAGAVVDRLTALADTWTRTREEARRSQAPPAVLARCDSALAAIAAARQRATARLAALLTLQVKVGENLATVEAASTRVTQAMSADMSTLFRRDRPALWHILREDVSLAELPAQVRDSAVPQLRVLGHFAGDRYRGILLHVGLLAVLLVFTVVARRRIHAWEAAGTVDPVLRVFDLPISTALIVTLLLSDWVYARSPMIAVNVMGLVLLIPAARILSRLAAPGPNAIIWVAIVFFILNRFREIALLSAPVMEQCAVVLLMGGAAVSLGWLGRRRAVMVGSYRVPDLLLWFATGALGASFVFAVFGYVRLARLLGTGVLRSAYAALLFYACGLVALAFFAYLLRIWPLARLHMVERHRLLFERRAAIFISWGLALFWFVTVLRWFSLLDAAQGAALAAFNYTITRGTMSVSLGDILVFVLTVVVAFQVSRFVRFALEEDAFPRLTMARGLPYAISSLLHYVILLLGFLLAVAALGLDMNRVTLLTGALGVGVGFGLQSVVNNFVSGIILLLERPIQVGDAIQLGSLEGSVRRIGLRSTTVRTWQGAEVIVPNASFISDQVTNWTFSDRRRRIDLPIGVAYGVDPGRVLDLLRATALTVPGVIPEPAPLALFKDFGDSALDFEIRAWTDRFEDWLIIKSRLGVAVNASFKDAGIAIPFPQRDVTIRFPPGEET